jgi:hypothetical protein
LSGKSDGKETSGGVAGAVVVHLEPRVGVDAKALVDWFRDIHVPEIVTHVKEIKAVRIFEFVSELRGDGSPPTKLLAMFEVEGDSFESIVESVKASSARSSGTDLRDPTRVVSFVYTEHLPVVFSRTE